MLTRLTQIAIPIATFLSAAAAIILNVDIARAQQPFFMGLGDLPGGPFFSWATDVSYDGSVVTGYSFISDRASPDSAHAFHWTRATGLVGLGAIGDYFNDIRISSDGSTIAGDIGTQNGDHPFRWTAETGVVRLPTGVWRAQGVSGDGSVIVGAGPPPWNNGRAIKWSEAGGVERLFTGLTNTWAYDISADGSVNLGRHGAGSSPIGSLFVQTPQDGITFIQQSDVLTLFNDPEISDDGKVVVGSFGTNVFDSGQAFRWTKETGLVYLGPLPDGKRTVSGRGVSSDGSIIIGNSEANIENRIEVAGINVTREPFIWDQDHGPRYLFDVLKTEYGLSDALAGWSHLGNVYAVSGDGRTIVGLGVNPDGNGEAWVAYLGPSTAALPGDYNANGTVDAADYVVWRNNAGSQQDYQTWRAHFGKTAAAAAANPTLSAISEPSTFLVAALALTSFAFRRHRLQKAAEAHAPRCHMSLLNAVLLVACHGAASARAQQPFFMGLGDLPGGAVFSWATDVSNDGSVVSGWSKTGITARGTDITEAFRWTRDTGLVGLGAIGDYFNEVKISTDGSTIIGTIGDGRPFRWTDTTGLTGIPAVTFARGISGDGSIIVGQIPSAGGWQAIKWTEAGGVKSLFPGYAPTWAWDVSADGSVILGQDDESILISAKDGITSIEGIMDARGAGRTSLSENGQVVVGSDILGPGANDRSAFRWSKDIGVKHLGPLPDGKRTRAATGVSADGSIIVGNSEFDLENFINVGVAVGSEPFMWDQTHGARYLFDVLRAEYGLADALTGWSEFTSVSAISGDGRTIVGLGVNPTGNGEAWIAYLGPPPTQVPGDYNANGTVDAADYVVWRNRAGTPQEYET
jgi:probable HAF family extracellular repeat protein